MAVNGEAEIATEVQIEVLPCLKVTVPAWSAVAVNTTAVPTVAVVALLARATLTEDAANEVPTLSAETLV